MTLHIEKIKAICFDIDGTLNDTDDQYVERLLPYLTMIRFLLPGRDALKASRRFVLWLEAPGNFVLGLPDTFGFDGLLAGILDWMNKFNRKKIRSYQPISGVVEMVEKLSGKYKLAVVSARSEETTRDFVLRNGLEKYFTVIVGSLTVEHTKPYPDPILYAAMVMGVLPQECLMVGDTVVDIIAGRAAGSQTVGVLCGFGEELELKKAGADIILKTTPALVELLLS